MGTSHAEGTQGCPSSPRSMRVVEGQLPAQPVQHLHSRRRKQQEQDVGEEEKTTTMLWPPRGTSGPGWALGTVTARGARITARLRSSCSPLGTLCPSSMPCPVPLALHTLSLACGPAPWGCNGAAACPGEEEPRSLHSATQSLPGLLISLGLWTFLVQEGKLKHKAGRCRISVRS